MIKHFNIKYRPQIQAGEYKVRTAYGQPARIVCWDARTPFDQPIVALIEYNRDGGVVDMPVCYMEDGRYVGNNENYLIVDDGTPNLTDIEKAILSALVDARNPALDDDALIDRARTLAGELVRRNDATPRYVTDEPIY